jgi:hypothetical protein
VCMAILAARLSRAVRSSLYNMLTAQCSSHACVGVVSVSASGHGVWPGLSLHGSSTHVCCCRGGCHSFSCLRTALRHLHVAVFSRWYSCLLFFCAQGVLQG